MPQRQPITVEKPLVIWPAPRQLSRHPLQRRRLWLRMIETQLTTNSAHNPPQILNDEIIA
jgi:hypothetical protein